MYKFFFVFQAAFPKTTTFGRGTGWTTSESIGYSDVKDGEARATGVPDTQYPPEWRRLPLPARRGGLDGDRAPPGAGSEICRRMPCDGDSGWICRNFMPWKGAVRRKTCLNARPRAPCMSMSGECWPPCGRATSRAGMPFSRSWRLFPE